MANLKISQLPEIIVPNNNDIIPIINMSLGVGSTNKISISSIRNNFLISIPTFNGTTSTTNLGNGLVIDDGVVATGNRVLYDDGTWGVLPTGTNDEHVSITINDTTPGFLNVKLVGTSNKITTSINNSGGNEELQLNVGTDIFDKTIDDTDDISVGANKFVTAEDLAVLSNTTGTNSGDNVQATTTLLGIAEIATQTEVNTATDAIRIVTPETLENKTYGTFTGSIISDNTTLKTALQELEDAAATGLDYYPIIEIASDLIEFDGTEEDTYNLKHLIITNPGISIVEIAINSADAEYTKDWQFYLTNYGQEVLVIEDINGTYKFIGNRGEGQDVTIAPWATVLIKYVLARGEFILMSTDLNANDYTKLQGIASGAEVNVQSDWNSISGDSLILNKPTDLTDLSLHTADELSGVSAGNASALGNLTGTNTGDEVQATTSILGIAEIATQTEVNTGTDAIRIITPETLENKTHGTFSGDIVSDNATLKTIIQELETAIPISNIKFNIQSADYNATHNDWVDMTTGATNKTITFPLSPNLNDRIKVSKADSGIGDILINGNGNTINGDADDLISNQYTVVTYQFNGTEWRKY